MVREALVFGAGALVGGAVGGVLAANRVMKTYRLSEAEHVFSPYRHEYAAEPIPRERGEFRFTYYYDGFAGAFNKVGWYHIEARRAKGYAVEPREIHEYLVRFERRAEEAADFAIVHPLFFTRPEALDWLRRRHRYVIAVEVADTTKISRGYALYANRQGIDAVLLPSSFAVEAYKRSGVMNRLRLVPHGVDPLYGKPRDAIRTERAELKALREDRRPKILWFGLHSGRRKGRDVVREALLRLRRRRRDFLLVVKTGTALMSWDVRGYFSPIPAVGIGGWLSEEELVYLYDSCDILLHPYRGGAFELNVFEALARGLPTVVTGWGAVLDYADIHSAYLISPEAAVRIFPSVVRGHVGFGVDPSIDHTVELLEFVMDNLDYCKKRAAAQRGEFVQRSWDKVADRILEVCREVWATA